MMGSWAVLVLLVSACGFEHGALPSDAMAGGEGGTIDDARTDVMKLDAADPPLCDPADLDLRACYTFDGTTQDGSSYNNDATATGTSFTAGRRGQALVTTGGTVVVGATSSLDVTVLSIKVWIKPNTLPTGTARMGLLDSGSRYRLFVYADGALRCALTNGATLTTGVGKVTAGTWQRVTCTYDRAVMRIYVDGAEVGTLAAAGTVPAAGTGMVIGHNNPSGENFDGALDDLQVFDAIVTP